MSVRLFLQNINLQMWVSVRHRFLWSQEKRGSVGAKEQEAGFEVDFRDIQGYSFFPKHISYLLGVTENSNKIGWNNRSITLLGMPISPGQRSILTKFGMKQYRTESSGFFSELRVRWQKSERQNRNDGDVQMKGWKEAMPRESGVLGFAQNNSAFSHRFSKFSFISTYRLRLTFILSTGKVSDFHVLFLQL